MARVLLDTTYLLPVAGINVEGVEKNALRRLGAAGHEIFISEISLFELAAKGAKLAAEGRAEEDRISLAIQSILQDRSITRIAPYLDGVTRRSILFRRYHSDFIDCLILASSLEMCEAFVTEDETLSGNKAILKAVTEANPRFVISTIERMSLT